MANYTTLPEEQSWIAYLRARLPYSFKRIEEQRAGRERRFVLSEPEPDLGTEYHNFWRRGNVYYVSSLILDRHGLSDFWSQHIVAAEHGLLQGAVQGGYPWDWPPHTFFNVIQMEKVWQFALENHIDRERVVMTSCVQTVELCLKAIQAHVAYRQHREFSFRAGHHVERLYRDLPDSLREELIAESRAFAEDYSTHRARLSSDIDDLMRFEQQVDWAAIRKDTLDSAYTVFLDGTDPGGMDLSEDWLDRAMSETRDGEYHRYSPDESKDGYPDQQIAYGLTLGRFLYEHLFPVSLRGWASGRSP